MDSRVKAIREHPHIGEGSCSSIDECWEDGELMELFDKTGALSVERAIEEAMRIEKLFLEQSLNSRWGEDDDPELQAWKEWPGG